MCVCVTDSFWLPDVCVYQSGGCRSAWEELADWLTATYPWRSHTKSQPHNNDLPLLRLRPEDAAVSSTSLAAADHVTQPSLLPPEVDPLADDPLVCLPSSFDSPFPRLFILLLFV